MLQKYFRILTLLVIPSIMPAVAAAQARTKMVVGYASMSSVATTLWVAQEKGFFAKNGIDVQTVFIPGSPTLIATINTGDVHLAYTGGTATLGAAVGGLDMKILAAFSNHVQNDFVVRPEIKTPGGCQGETGRSHEHRRYGLDVGAADDGTDRLERGARQNLACRLRRPDE